jgi:hypothetical protein
LFLSVKVGKDMAQDMVQVCAWIYYHQLAMFREHLSAAAMLVQEKLLLVEGCMVRWRWQVDDEAQTDFAQHRYYSRQGSWLV